MQNVLSVKLNLDDGDFTRKMRLADGQVKTLGSSFKTTGNSIKVSEAALPSFTQKLRDTTLILGALRFTLMDIDQVLLGLPKSVVKVSGEFERLTQLFKGLSKASSETQKTLEAQKSLGFAIQTALNSPFDVGAIADSMVKLRVAGIEPTNGSLQALIDSIAKFGGNSESLKRASVAIQQMGGKGVISMEELRQQLGEAVPSAMQSMADAMGLSMAELTKRISTGTVESQTALGKMFANMTIMNGGAAKDMMTVWSGLTSQLQTRWMLLQKTIGDGGFYEELKQTVGDLIDMMGDEKVRALSNETGVFLRETLQSIRTLVENIIKYADIIGLAILVPMLKKATEAMAAFGNTRVGSPAIVSSFKEVIKKAEETQAVFKAVNLQRAQDLQETKFNLMQKAEAVRLGITAEKAGLTQSVDNAKAALEAKRVIDEQEIASRRNRIEQLKVMVAEESATIDRLNKQVRQAPNQAKRRVRQGERDEAFGNRDNMIQQIKAQEAAIDSLNSKHQKEISLLNERAQRISQGNVSNQAIQQKMKEVEAINTKIVSLEREQAQLLKTSKAGQVASNEQINALNATTKELAKARDMLNNNVVAIERLNGKVRLLTGTFGLLSRGAQAAGVAIKGFAISMATAMASMAIWMAAIQGLMYVWDKLSESIDRAGKAQKRYNDIQNRIKTGNATKEDIESLDKDIESKESEIAVRSRRSRSSTQESLQKRKEDLDRMKAELAKLKAQKADAMKVINENSFEDGKSASLGDRIARQVTREYEQTIFTLQEQTRTLKEGSPEQKKALAALVEAQKNNLRGIVAKLDEAIISESALVAGAQGESESKGRFQQGIVEGLKAKRDAISEQLFNLSKENKFNVPVGDKAPSKAETLASRLQASYAEAVEKMKVADKDLTTMGEFIKQAEAKYQALLKGGALKVKGEDGKFSNPNKSTVDMFVMREAIADMLARGESVKGKISTLTENIEGDLKEAESKFSPNTDFFSSRMKQINALVEESAQYAQNLREAAKFADKKDRPAFQEAAGRIETQIADMQRKGAETEVLEFRNSQKSKLVELEKSLMTESQLRDYDFEMEIQKTAEHYTRMIELQEKAGLSTVGLTEEMFKALVLTRDKYQREQLGGLQKIVEDWENAQENMQKMTGDWANRTMGEITNLFTKGRLNIRGLLAGILQDIAEAQIKKAFASTVGNLFSMVGTALGGAYFGGSSGATGPAGGAVGGTGITFNTSAFANGGIMTAAGSLALKKYANGGIANSPQLALYGEGSMPEAYVPLPDGRTIPVTMTGGGSGSNSNIVINISIDKSGAENTSVAGQDAQGAKRLGEAVKRVVQQEIAAQTRPGGMLYR